MKLSFSEMERNARIKKLERDFEFTVGNIFQNEIVIDFYKTVDGAKSVDNPLHKITETEEMINKQKIELAMIKELLKKEYGKK